MVLFLTMKYCTGHHAEVFKKQAFCSVSTRCVAMLLPATVAAESMIGQHIETEIFDKSKATLL
jgi:hypothetical protein